MISKIRKAPKTQTAIKDVSSAIRATAGSLGLLMVFRGDIAQISRPRKVPPRPRAITRPSPIKTPASNSARSRRPISRLGAAKIKNPQCRVVVVFIFGASTAVAWVFPRKSTLFTRSTIQPDRTPTVKDNGNTTNAASGRVAIKRNAASPIVAVRVATTAPNPTCPDEYAATTTTAPPQPGIAPNTAAKGTCIALALCIFSGRLTLNSRLPP